MKPIGESILSKITTNQNPIEMIPVNLPRPRPSDVIATPEFGTYVGRLWTLLREEASRGMVESEAEIASR